MNTTSATTIASKVTDTAGELITSRDGDMIEITTAARIRGGETPIATVEVGFREPMESSQLRYLDQLVGRFNAHDDLLAALKDLSDRLKSTDKDNMEFEIRLTYYQVDKIRAAIAKAEGR